MDELVEKAKQGDKQAFENLIISIEDELYKIAKIKLNNIEDVNDAVQETIEKVFKSIRKLKNIKYFKTWVIKILINECNKVYKQRNKRKDYIIDDIENINIQFQTNLDSDLMFYNIIEPLNNDERIILILFYMERYTTKEISKILKINENTIKSRLSRAKEKIKQREEEEKNGRIG